MIYSSDQIVTKKLKPEIILEGLCKMSGLEDCGNLDKTVLGLKSHAATHALCDVTDPENLNQGKISNHAWSSSTDSTSYRRSLFYDDDDDANNTDDGNSCSYSCKDQCPQSLEYKCQQKCIQEIPADCRFMEDPMANPACVEAFAECAEHLLECCPCPCTYKAYCCSECGAPTPGPNGCPPGYTSTDVGASTCTACAPGTYKTTVGFNACTTCSPYSIGCGGASAGECDVGFGSTDGGLTCTLCAPGYYKTTVGNTACTTCSPNNTGCGGVSAGECDAGYASTDGGVTCVACIPDTYKFTLGNTSCSECPAGKHSGAGASECFA